MCICYLEKYWLLMGILRIRVKPLITNLVYGYLIQCCIPSASHETWHTIEAQHLKYKLNELIHGAIGLKGK